MVAGVRYTFSSALGAIFAVVAYALGGAGVTPDFAMIATGVIATLLFAASTALEVVCIGGVVRRQNIMLARIGTGIFGLIITAAACATYLLGDAVELGSWVLVFGGPIYIAACLLVWVLNRIVEKPRVE